MKKIKYYLENEPLKAMLFVGLLLRLVSVIFAKGFGMFDDHFVVIELAQKWLDATDASSLPWNSPNQVVDGHSLFYIGINFLILSFFKFIEINNPDTKMYIIRLIHAFYSLLVISLSYKITLKLSNRKNANQVGWILTFAWFMPWLSVRNLVEMVCIPPLLFSIWWIIKNDKDSFWKYFIAGLIGALAFSIRFQTITFIGGIGLVLLFKDKFKNAIFFGLGALLSIVIFQGGIDLYIWHRPFAEFTEYVNYNLHNSGEYPNGPWYNYILLLGGIFIPPFGLMLLIGFLKTNKKLLILFVPTIIFIIFHSYFPNKQERFILPILPMYLSLGIIGWNSLLETKLNSLFWKKFTKISWIIFLVINFAVLPIITTTYYKQNRVESMLYFYGKAPLKTLVIDATNKRGYSYLPFFYSGDNWKTTVIEIKKEQDYQIIKDKKDISYILFFSGEKLDTRIEKVEQSTNKKIKQEYIAAPGYVDNLLQKMNPVNIADTIFIYSIKNN